MSDQTRNLDDVPYAVFHEYYTKVRDHSFAEKKNPTSYNIDMGTHRFNSSTAFPEGSFDFNSVGANDPEDAFDAAGNGLVKDYSLLTFKHSGYDNAGNGKTYRVTFTLLNLTDAEAGGTRSSQEGREREHKEWYLDHDCGYRDNTYIVRHPTEHSPTRNNPGKTTDSEPYFSINHIYQPLTCLPGHCVGIVTRSAEKDANAADAIDIANQMMDWIGTFNQYTSKPDLPTEWDVVYAVIGKIFDWLVAGAQDDPMCPTVTAISQGAARYIAEHCGGTFNFTRKVWGQDCGLADITDYPAPPHDMTQPYFFKLKTATNRSFTLEYEIQVREIGEPSGKTFYYVKYYSESEGTEKYWFKNRFNYLGIGDFEKTAVYFEKGENGFYRIYLRDTGEFLRASNIGMHSGNSWYQFYATEPLEAYKDLGWEYKIELISGWEHKILYSGELNLYDNGEAVIEANAKNEIREPSIWFLERIYE